MGHYDIVTEGPPDPPEPARPADPPRPPPSAPMRVVITSIDIPFGEMVQLIVSFVIAAIPAGILLSILFAVWSYVLAMVIGRRGF